MNDTAALPTEEPETEPKPLLEIQRVHHRPAVTPKGSARRPGSEPSGAGSRLCLGKSLPDAICPAA